MSDKNFKYFTVNILLKPVCFAFIDTTLVMKMKCQEEEIFISKKFFFFCSFLMKKRNFKKNN